MINIKLFAVVVIYLSTGISFYARIAKLISLYHHKNAEYSNINSSISAFFNSGLWLFYGIVLNLNEIIINSVVSIILSVFTLLLTLHYIKLNEEKIIPQEIKIGN